MTESKRNVLGQLLKQARDKAGLGTHELGKRAGVQNSTILRIEQGISANPRPDVLRALADALHLDLADVFTAAGYAQPSNYPSFSPYLRSRYADLPRAAQSELEASFGQIVEKYGYDPEGPNAGEDEAN